MRRIYAKILRITTETGETVDGVAFFLFTSDYLYKLNLLQY